MCLRAVNTFGRQLNGQFLVIIQVGEQIVREWGRTGGGRKPTKWTENGRKTTSNTQTKRNETKSKQSNKAMANNFHKTGFSGQLPSVAGSFYFRTRAENRNSSNNNISPTTAQTASFRYKCILRCVRGDSGYVGVSLCRCYCCCLFADVFWLIIYLVGALPLHVACQTRLFWYFRWPFNSQY